jgi:hypothetical protein
MRRSAELIVLLRIGRDIERAQGKAKFAMAGYWLQLPENNHGLA